ncbi:PH domain-containing protein [Nakamurella deserti]|uniref:PH domain-containing protein n=1 Tax=Nakamurella deserti TaxID=2164074 RepID=UPI000DBE7711|nr:PH domain-containing protein [Nakamurella deserti]
MDQHTDSPANALFAPPDASWQRLTSRYLSMRRLVSAVVIGVVTVVAAAVVTLATARPWLGGVVVVIGVVSIAVRLVVVTRNWRSWGYAERDEDLYLTHGVLFRRLTAVPYGRMQVVEVTSGPLQRAYGLATVSLQTASPGTGAQIPGLLPDEAVRLRDRLTERGRTRAMNL